MTEMNLKAKDGARIVLVTGVSGAGKSSALKAFEDMGYEAIDNVPISLIDRLIAYLLTCLLNELMNQFIHECIN